MSEEVKETEVKTSVDRNPFFLPALIVGLIPVVFLVFYYAGGERFIDCSLDTLIVFFLYAAGFGAISFALAGLVDAKKMQKPFIGCVICFVLAFFEVLFIFLWVSPDLSRARKPVIYLYPETTAEVNVKLETNGKLTSTYPKYETVNGWTVTAEPDGTLTDKKGRQYSYLYWEGDIDIKPDLDMGFCVKGEDTAAFLEDSLEQLGLNDKEADDFITYWLPLMEGNRYNVITFQTTAYEEAASLQIAPKPDTVIRALVSFKSKG